MKGANSIIQSILTFIIFIISMNVIRSYHSSDDYFCANHTEQCESTLALPCCDLNDTCTRIGWGAFQHEYRCIKEAYLEDHCETTLDCHKVFYAECSKEKKCKCHLNFITVGNSKCIPPLNEFCTSDSDCLTQNSTCKDSQCKCKFDFRPTSDNQCVPKKLFKFCRKDKDCEDIIHAQCNNDYECVCRPNNVAVNDSVCLPDINAFCWKNEPCAIENSVCTDRTCKCKPRYKNINNRLCLKTYLGMPCKHDIECADIRNSKCYMNKLCSCNETAMKINDTFCAPLLGGFCINDKQCLADNSACIDNVCQCKISFFSDSRFNCIPYPLGKICNTNVLCKDSRHKKCSKDNLCVCQPSHISINGSVCLPVIEGFCFTDDECHPDNSRCLHHRCQCQPGFTAMTNDKCVKENVPSSCSLQNHCDHLTLGECSSRGKCLCRSNTILYNQKCWPIIEGYCVNNDDCLIRNSYCIENKCQCTPDFFASSQYSCQLITMRMSHRL